MTECRIQALALMRSQAGGLAGTRHAAYGGSGSSDNDCVIRGVTALANGSLFH